MVGAQRALEVHQGGWALTQEIRLYSEVAACVKEMSVVVSLVTIPGERTLWVLKALVKAEVRLEP